MKKRLVIFLLFLAVIPSAIADDMWFYRSSYLILEPAITTSFDIIAKQSSKIDYVVANISFFPRQTRTQSIMESVYEPMPIISEDTLSFEWKNPAPGAKEIKIKNKVKTINSPARIIKKVDFPLKEGDVPDEIMVYTEPSDIIDINSRIINLASELASGEDDLFEAVDKVAAWVNANIKYNLSTVTVEAAQKSSWVLENREGVCDEITSLFISMLRSLGIPARFVSGISYTNLDIFEKKWGPHGWAEVYFPGYGWVPYDVTYGEYGWIDATHIQAKAAEDAGKFASRYAWRAEHGVTLEVGDLNTEVNIAEQGSPRPPFVSITTEVLKDSVGFDSYNLVTARVKNLNNYYHSLDVYLSHTTRLSYLDNSRKHITLAPNEEENVYWLIKTDKDFDRDYIYTFPLAVYTLDNVTSQASFTSVFESPKYSLEQVNRTVSQVNAEEKLEYSKNVIFNCTAGKSYYYPNEKPGIKCAIKNNGNIFLKGLKVCLGEECQERNVGITEEQQISFIVHDGEMGWNEFRITAKNNDVSKVSYVMAEMLDEPKLDMDDISYPFNVSYGGLYVFRFKLEKESYSAAQDTRVIARINRQKKEMELGNITEDAYIEMPFDGKDFSINRNIINITIEYKNRDKKQYELNRDFPINLADVTLLQKVLIFIRTIF